MSNVGSFSDATVKEGDWLTLGGFPGAFREYDGKNECIYDSFSYGGSEVNHCTEEKIYASFDIDSCLLSGRRSSEEMPDLGGVSGGPVFIPSNTEMGLLNYQLAGIFYKIGDDFQLAKIKPASLIDDNGVIVSGDIL